jgi:hypothetical protein
MSFGFGDDLCDVECSNLGPYINGWVDCSGIQLSHPQTVIKRLEGGDPVRKLFELFLPKGFWDAILQWTNDNLVEKLKKPITKGQFCAYVGLEVAMSIHPLNDMKDFWSTKRFCGVQDFQGVMSRNHFQLIRGSLAFQPNMTHLIRKLRIYYGFLERY